MLKVPVCPNGMVLRHRGIFTLIAFSSCYYRKCEKRNTLSNVSSCRYRDERELVITSSVEQSPSGEMIIVQPVKKLKHSIFRDIMPCSELKEASRCF
jgi:hypothetical protein